MNSIIENKGFESGNFYIPSFTLLPGEYLCLNFSSTYDVNDEIQIVDILTGTKESPAVKVLRLVGFVLSDIKYSFFNQFFRPKKAFSLLRESTRVSDEDIISTLNSFGIKSDESVQLFRSQ